MISRTWHNLHQTLGTGKGYCLRVEGRLLITLSCHQSPVPTDITTIGHEVLIVMRDDTTLGIKHRREDAASYLLGSEQSRLFLLDIINERGMIPRLELSHKIGLTTISLDMTRRRPCNEICLARIKFMNQFDTVATHIDTQATAQ